MSDAELGGYAFVAVCFLLLLALSITIARFLQRRSKDN